MNTKKYVCMLFVALMFLAVVSGGCGGGGGGSSSDSSKGTNQNQTNENTTPDTDTDEEPFDPTVPTSLNGTWNVDTGKVDVTTTMDGTDVGGIKATYAAGTASEVTLTFLSDDEDGINYTLVVSGNNVRYHSSHGDTLRFDTINNENQSSSQIALHTGFYSHRTFTRTGLNTFVLNATEDNTEDGTMTVKLKLKLEGSSLRWTESTVSVLSTEALNLKTDALVDFVFKR